MNIAISLKLKNHYKRKEINYFKIRKFNELIYFDYFSVCSV
jgi:hypothetical protein